MLKLPDIVVKFQVQLSKFEGKLAKDVLSTFMFFCAQERESNNQES